MIDPWQLWHTKREGGREREGEKIIQNFAGAGKWHFPVYGEKSTKNKRNLKKNSLRNKEAFIVKIYQRSIFNRTGFDLVVLAPALL